jgi:hypothetical protein
MRRSGFHYGAVVLAVVIVFAPRPPAIEVSSSPGDERGLLIGRALAPTIDAVDIRKQDTGRSMRKPTPAFWMVCVLAAAAMGLCLRALSLIKSLSQRLLIAAVGTRGSRAPPLVLA